MLPEKGKKYIIDNIDDYKYYKSLRPAKYWRLIHVVFRCSKCNNTSELILKSLTDDFICKKCKAKLIQNNPEVRQKQRQTCIEKYGTEYAIQNKDVYDKKKSTMQERYGTEIPLRNSDIKEKFKSTCIDKYGTEYPAQFDPIKEKTKTTNRSRYGGTGYASKELSDKAKLTNIERYDNEYPQALDIIKEKIKHTNRERYGTECSLQNPDIGEKAKNTNREKYGVDCPLKSEQIRDKIKTTIIEKYGVDNVSKNVDIRNKVKQTCLEKYGYENYNMSPDAKERLKECNVKKQIKYYAEKTQDQLTYNNGFFTGICHTCHSTYTIDRQMMYRRTLINIPPCTYCCPIYKPYSMLEKSVVEYIRGIYKFTVIENERTVLNGKELDIYLPDIKMGIEFNGTFYHADPRFYDKDDIIINRRAEDIWINDYNKDMLCETAGIFLYRIWEYDWLNYNDSVKNEICKCITVLQKNPNKIP